MWGIRGLSGSLMMDLKSPRDSIYRLFGIGSD